jgi:hypothetical protein
VPAVDEWATLFISTKGLERVARGTTCTSTNLEHTRAGVSMRDGLHQGTELGECGGKTERLCIVSVQQSTLQHDLERCLLAAQDGNQARAQAANKFAVDALDSREGYFTLAYRWRVVPPGVTVRRKASCRSGGECILHPAVELDMVGQELGDVLWSQGRQCVVGAWP